MGIINKSVAVAREAHQARDAAKTRKSAATREKILQAARDLMVERGSTNFQMSEVSARCNMSKGSLYYYFSDKEALVHEVFDSSVSDLANAVERIVANAPSASDSILKLVEILARSIRPGEPLALAMARGPQSGSRGTLASVEEQVARIVTVLAAQIERAKSEGLVVPGVNSRMSALAITGAFAFFDYVSGEEGELASSAGLTPESSAAPVAQAYDPELVVHDVLGMIFSGIGTTQAREQFPVHARS